jgi:fucose permease
LFLASIFPTTLSLAERRMPISGKVTGWFCVGVGAGGVFLLWFMGPLFEGIGLHVTQSRIRTGEPETSFAISSSTCFSWHFSL